jgi:hypothetical protein
MRFWHRALRGFCRWPHHWQGLWRLRRASVVTLMEGTQLAAATGASQGQVAQG